MLSKASEIVAPLLLTAALEMPLTSALLQVNTGVGVVLLVIVYGVAVLSHQLAVAELVTIEVGFTVTATSNGVPVHPDRKSVV